MLHENRRVLLRQVFCPYAIRDDARSIVAADLQVIAYLGFFRFF